jgi:hypothetical protein
MKPEQIAKDSESSHQQALFCMAALHLKIYPELQWMHHIPNGGARADDARGNAIRGGKLKAEGVKEGIPDIFLPVARQNCHGLYIEMKKPAMRPKRPGSSGGVSEKQAEFRDFAHKQGYGWVVCYDWLEAWEMIVKYLVGEG